VFADLSGPARDSLFFSDLVRCPCRWDILARHSRVESCLFAVVAKRKLLSAVADPATALS